MRDRLAQSLTVGAVAMLALIAVPAPGRLQRPRRFVQHAG